MKRTIPYGYEYRDGYIDIEITASSVIREIYIDYLNGKSFATIAKQLTGKGIDYYLGKTARNHRNNGKKTPRIPQDDKALQTT